MKNRRRIIFVRQGIQGAFPLIVSLLLLLASAVIGYFMYSRCESALKSCLTFSHIKCDAPIELVRDEVTPYIAGGVGVIILILGLLYGLFIFVMKKAFRELGESIEMASKGNLIPRDHVNMPYEIMLLKEKLNQSMGKIAESIDAVETVVGEVESMAKELVESGEEGETSRISLALEKEVKNLRHGLLFFKDF